MSIVLRHPFFVRDLFDVPFQTRHGTAFHNISRNSVSHVHQKVPKRSRKAPFKPSKPLQTKPDPIHKKPVQAPSRIGLPLNEEQELLDGSITAKPDGLVHEKPFKVPRRIKTVRSQNQKQERFASSVTMGAAPSPRHVPAPMFCLREKTN